MAAIELALRRDRLVILAALLVMTAVAAGYVVWLSADMSMFAVSSAAETKPGMTADAPGGNMVGMDMGAAVLPGFRVWSVNDFAFILVMWAVMMVGMMTPSVAPMVLLYAMVGRSAVAGGRPFAATGWFFSGYIATWVSYSALATLAQWGLTRLALLMPMMAAADRLLGGAILLAAGIYEWTPMKAACLKACQGPMAFLASRGGFRADPSGALKLGIEHGLYCLGCCWALMALLFVGGVMNLLWIAGLAVLILLEKTLPGAGPLVPRISGLLLAAAGLWLLAGALPFA